MHIAMVVFSDLRFDYRVFREATSLVEAGHQVSIVSSAFAETPLGEWKGIDVHLIPVDRSASLRLLYPQFWRQATQRLKSLAADAYHAHDLDVLWPAWRAAHQRDVPLVYDSHEFWIEQSSLVNRRVIRGFWSQLERRLIGQANRVITVSPSIGQNLEQTYGLEDVVILRNLPLYREPVTSDLIHLELGLESGRPIVLYQGGFLTANGLDLQIKAAAQLDQAALVLIGDGPTQDQLKAQVRTLGLEHKVYFIARVPFQKLHQYTCSADLGLCLIQGIGQSFYYSLPNKLFEYLMAGLPVLASNFPDMGQIVNQEGVGQTIDPSDVSAIGKHITDLLANTELRQQYSQAALQAAKRYNWEHEAAKLIGLYAKF
jgi:glycosyltransferase involved in cell wall biosynthesis